MNLISCREISHTFGTRQILDRFTLSIEDGQRLALVGSNGCGKSTFLKLLAGELEADSGEICRRRGIKIEIVSQFLPPEICNQTLFESIADSIEKASFGSALDYEVESWLQRLGFREDQFSTPLKNLSGGETNLALLARALAAKPDLLLLDEPSNHMDIKNIQQFEKILLEEANCSFCLVSHDRELLDRVTSHTIFIREGRAYAFDLPYSKARSMLAAQDLAAAKRRHDEESKIERLSESAKRLAIWGRDFNNEKFASRARNIERRVERLKASVTQLVKEERKAVALATKTAEAKYLLQATDVHVCIAESRELFRIEHLHLCQGERLALIGPNGIGKSTFLKLLMQEHQQTQNAKGLRFNPQVSIGYYDQQLAALDSSLSLFASVRQASSMADQLLREALIKAGFDYARHQRTVGHLSGGEKARLMFLLLKLKQANLLLLDEPTNHLDVWGIESMEEQLLSTNTTCILVSHDRRFIEKIVTRAVTIEDGELVEL